MPTVLFTSETASEMGRKGGLSPKRLSDRPKATPSDRFQARRLTRVRRQLNMIDDQLEWELSKDGSLDPDTGKPRTLDAQLIDRLAAASMRLSDQEFALANRPKPAMAKVQPQGRARRELPPPMPIQDQEAPKPTPGDVPPQSITPSPPAAPRASSA